jgi:P-type Ca2+ transporter type 2C
MRTLADVATEFPAAPDAGLSEEQIVASRQRYGGNRLTPRPRSPIWRALLAKFDDPIIRVLLAASLLKILVDLYAVSGRAGTIGLILVTFILGGCVVFRAWRPFLPALLFAAAAILIVAGTIAGRPSYDGLAVMIAVGLATGVAFAAEFKSDREFEFLNAGKEAILVKVMRGGEFRTIPLNDVVVGDRVQLEMGDEVPADGRLESANELDIDQSLMTGESEPAHKTPGRPDDAADGPDHAGCLYRGTQAVDGVGRLLVAAVGDETMLGGIARSLGMDEAGARVRDKLSIAKDLTPLQAKLKRLAARISAVGYTAAVAIFIALLVKGALDGTLHWPVDRHDFGRVVDFLIKNFVIMVVVIVVAVPEGLPMSVTLSLALAMRKMTAAKSLVRQLIACETIGSATVICSDKTGTLTQNRMQVVEVVRTDSSNSNSSPDWFALIAAVNSTAELEFKDGQATTIGNSTEGALLRWLHERGIDYRDLRRQNPAIYQMHFSSERQRMTTVIRHDGRLLALVKGAPERLLDRSASLPPAERSAIEARLTATAARAIRTLGFAIRELPVEFGRDEDSLHQRRESLDQDLTFLGFAAIHDPLRPDVRDAVSECRTAGIDVKMITGDVAATAQAIAGEIGLLDQPDGLVMTSAEFTARSDAEISELLPRLRLLARARPLDKYRLVSLLQARGEVVAMTGDGTNDAPSLKKADVGLAMGITGTEVAKEASKIVLLDDSFATIVRAVRWGRALFENIQRFVQFQLTINLSALIIAFLAPFLGFGEPPFTVLQFLWINIIMDTFAAIALCSEPPRPGLMHEPPKRRDDDIISPTMWRTIAATAAFYVAVMIVLLLGMKGPAQSPGWFAGDGPRSDEFPLFTVRQATIFFTTYVFFQLWNLINCRSLAPSVSGLARLGANRAFLLIAALIVAGQVGIVTFGGSIFQVEPLGVVDWLIIAIATSSVLMLREVVRLVLRSRA